ncbi:hypothetical protein BJ138DRAFT_1129385 [Hygrophoropsis aurantiaca]|uniref:Uncharacterized protein n=1 Tax=Hygrophoropsis aurantiaca TaxID=72124 RepID=A0ACB8A2F8_9AGAM|nr:hypothetical protein BJ138DRAFT_1129385 [Hygrophoropsis aurantiaca]
MHPALLIQEIQLYILNQLGESRQLRGTLKALAATCHAFTEAALNVLWRDLDCFARLIQCMPQDLWTVGRPPVGPTINSLVITLRRSMAPSDWDIFQKYSRRVRRLKTPINTFSRRSSINLDDACILAMCSPSAPTPLLPNLKSLDWVVESDVHFKLLTRLLSPSLISLELTEICPTLRSLSVNGDKYFPPGFLEGLKQSISQLQYLDNISWDKLGNKNILSLAHLPSLTRAVFDIPSDLSTYIAALRLGSARPAFSRLCALQSSDCSLASVTAFLNHFNVDLEEISLEYRGRSQSQTSLVRDLIAALGSSSSHYSLCDFSLRYHKKNYGSHPTGLHSFGIHELRPLLKFHQLEYLDLNIPCPIIMNDATLLEISDAWPNISSLILNESGQWLPGSYATPAGLVALLSKCQHLFILSLAVDFSTIDSVDFDPLSIGYTRPTRYEYRTPLHQLFLGPFNISHPHAVARFLSIIFPNHAKISMMRDYSESPDDDDARTSRRWSLTKDIYRKFCAGLRNEDKLTEGDLSAAEHDASIDEAGLFSDDDDLSAPSLSPV